MTKAPEIIHFICNENSPFPNNPVLPVVIYKDLFSGQIDLANSFEDCFSMNNWPAAWRNGLYDFHHYHSTAHEVLGVYSGWVLACFGGPGGREEKATKGDVIVIPAGVSHKNLAQSVDFKVVGGYPKGQRWNMCYGKESERPQADKEIKFVPPPEADPVAGLEGPLIEIWEI